MSKTFCSSYCASTIKWMRTYTHYICIHSHASDIECEVYMFDSIKHSNWLIFMSLMYSTGMRKPKNPPWRRGRWTCWLPWVSANNKPKIPWKHLVVMWNPLCLGLGRLSLGHWDDLRKKLWETVCFFETDDGRFPQNFPKPLQWVYCSWHLVSNIFLHEILIWNDSKCPAKM